MMSKMDRHDPENYSNVGKYQQTTRRAIEMWGEYWQLYVITVRGLINR